jgi:glyoxylase-like metal-dependent hydrolase (beta-lactamase superfamily II)
MDIVNLGYRSTNYYALPVNGGKLLVDCGWYGMMSQFLAQFKRKGVDPAQVKYVLATHYHMDHAGLVNEFKKLGAQLILMQSQLAALVQGEPPTPVKPPLLITTSDAGNILLKFAESRKFLDSIGLAGEIVATPAHSQDSVSLVLDDGSAFTGDLPPRTLISDEDPRLRESWAELDRRHVRHVYPAHGN